MNPQNDRGFMNFRIEQSLSFQPEKIKKILQIEEQNRKQKNKYSSVYAQRASTKLSNNFYNNNNDDSEDDGNNKLSDYEN